MNSQICVNCLNEKPVNSTDNRLVTESCGHIKCMKCLLLEKAGCSACVKEKGLIKLSRLEDVNNENTDSEQPKAKSNKEIKDVVKDYEENQKKHKPDTSHISIETDESGRYYFCAMCKKKFHAKSQVAYHAYCNGQRKPFQCPECVKSFATLSHFKYHMRVHRNERTYSCEDCGESFFQMSKLQRHKLKHTNEKKYSCGQCTKGFNNLSALRKHELTHTEHRPFACAICGRRFRDSSNYKKHVDKHEGKKCNCDGSCAHCSRGNEGSPRAHQCPRCLRGFHSRKDMRRHAAVHTDSKPFGCKVCNRRFRRKDNLERHIRNTHPDYVPATAVDCDLLALKQISNSNGQTAEKHNGTSTVNDSDKTMLKILNPLPPLPPEVIRKEINVDNHENVNHNQLAQVGDKTVIEKSYILEANNARQSVIVNKSAAIDKKVPQSNEYVHKIRKANSMASQKNISLPPIDEKKMLELEHKTSLNNLDLGAPPKDMELYKKILYEKSEIDISVGNEDELKGQQTSPEMHWRRKLKLNMNW